jgi:hypothetical protein
MKGLETTWAMILNGAVQRTYSFEGKQCTITDLSTDTINMRLSLQGASLGWVCFLS